MLKAKERDEETSTLKYRGCTPVFLVYPLTIVKNTLAYNLHIQYHASRQISFKHALKHDVYISKLSYFRKMCYFTP